MGFCFCSMNILEWTEKHWDLIKRQRFNQFFRQYPFYKTRFQSGHFRFQTFENFSDTHSCVPARKWVIFGLFWGPVRSGKSWKTGEKWGKKARKAEWWYSYKTCMHHPEIKYNWQMLPMFKNPPASQLYQISPQSLCHCVHHPTTDEIYLLFYG